VAGREGMARAMLREAITVNALPAGTVRRNKKREKR